MKAIKKTLTMLLAVVMVMGLSITAFAEETTTGSITVKNADSTATYTAYKIFDVTYADTDNTKDGYEAYSYSISTSSAWLDTIITYISGYTKVDGKWYADSDLTDGQPNGDAEPATTFTNTTKGLTLTLSADGDEYVVTTTSDFSAASFANALYSALYGYTEVSEGTEFDSTVTYYVKNGTSYSKCVGLTAFAEGVTYYTQTSTTLLSSVTGKALTYDANKKEASVSGLELGYYFVTSSVGSLANLTSTDPDVTIYDKNEVAPFEKEANDVDVEIGQTVTYTITGKVPSTTGYTKYNYTVTDTLSTGLTFNKDVTVKFGNDAQTITTVTDADATLADGQIRYSDDGFELYFDMTQHQADVDDVITITYTAVVNEKAVVTADGNPNNATLVYSNNPDDSSSTSTLTEEEKVYTIDLTIDKYAGGQTVDKYTYTDGENNTVTVYSKDGETYYTDTSLTTVATIPDDATVTKGEAVADTSTKLSGAKFVLVKKDSEGNETFYKYTAADASTNTAAKVEWVNSVTDATVVTTNEKGTATFDGLEAGTYYLRETEAPAGYNLLTSDVPVTITRTEDTTTTTVAISGNEVAVANSAGTELPSTGGIGTTIFYVVGSILVIGAAVLLITKKRMSGAEK